MPSLFDPIRLGAIRAPNRVLMAPLTRARNTRDHVPTPLMVEYYRQRAGAGLILSEATAISLHGMGWPYAPGIWSREQVGAWRAVTDAVHAEGGRIMCQLWHMGRLVHPSLPGRLAQPLSASDVTAPGLAHTYDGKQPYAQPRPLGLDEIPGIHAQYRQAAAHAMEAGFDGVQLHGANGYLVDQFLRDVTNHRDDGYGGAVENRVRFLVEAVREIVAEVGAERTAVRLSPNGERHGVNDSDPEPLFTAAAAALSPFGLAFLELREPGFDGTNGTADRPPIAPAMRRVFAGPMVLNADYDAAKAQAALDAGAADAISFGRAFISNPDLVHRLEAGHSLAADDMATWYTQGAEGYTTYPAAH